VHQGFKKGGHRREKHCRIMCASETETLFTSCAGVGASGEVDGLQSPAGHSGVQGAQANSVATGSGLLEEAQPSASIVKGCDMLLYAESTPALADRSQLCTRDMTGDMRGVVALNSTCVPEDRIPLVDLPNPCSALRCLED
jgi:hypothetical protein